MYVNMNNSKEEINKTIEFNKSFSNYTSNYILLIIYHRHNNFRHHYFDYKDNIHFLYLYTTSVSDGKEFLNEEDNLYLDNIIKSKYKLSNINLYSKCIQNIMRFIKTHYPYQMLYPFLTFLLENKNLHEIQKSSFSVLN